MVDILCTGIVMYKCFVNYAFYCWLREMSAQIYFVLCNVHRTPTPLYNFFQEILDNQCLLSFHLIYYPRYESKQTVEDNDTEFLEKVWENSKAIINCNACVYVRYIKQATLWMALSIKLA